MQISKISFPVSFISRSIDFKQNYNGNNSISFTSKQDVFEKTIRKSVFSKKQSVDDVLAREDIAVGGAKQLIEEADSCSAAILKNAAKILEAAKEDIVRTNERTKILEPKKEEYSEILMDICLPDKNTDCVAIFNKKGVSVHAFQPAERKDTTNNYYFSGETLEDIKLLRYYQEHSHTKNGEEKADFEMQFKSDGSNWMKYVKKPVYTEKVRKGEDYLYKTDDEIIYYKEAKFFPPFTLNCTKKAKTELILNNDLSIRSYGEGYDYKMPKSIKYYSIFHSDK